MGATTRTFFLDLWEHGVNIRVVIRTEIATLCARLPHKSYDIYRMAMDTWGLDANKEIKQIRP